MSEVDRPAPGELELLRAFLNTRDVEEGTDALTSARGLGAWLAARGLTRVRPTAAEARRARALREALRSALLGGPVPFEPFVGAVTRGAVRLELDVAGRTRLAATADGVDGALGELTVRVHRAQADGSWARLKVCPDPDCLWAFYDASRNRSSRWCAMGDCGNRAKVRAFRRRRATTVR